MILAASLGGLPQIAVADSELTLHATEASVQIMPQKPGQEHVSLPTLHFSVRAEFDCGEDAVAESVMISIADSHQRHAPGADKGSYETSVKVAHNQIAAPATGDFCVVDSTQSDDELLLPGVATAQGSLRCRSGTGVSVQFASTGLPLRLVCEGGVDQDSSVAATAVDK